LFECGDGNRVAATAAPQIRTVRLHAVSPRIAPLAWFGAGAAHRPSARLHPFRIGRQSFSHPAGVGERFEPTDADDRMLIFPYGRAAMTPKARGGFAREVDEVEHRGPNLLGPQRHLLVAALLDERQEFGVGDWVAVEVH